MSILNIDKINELLQGLLDRGYGDRERLFRKLIEEIGEYAEAIEYDNGATRKKEKFKDQDPKELLEEELSDIFMVVLALATCESISVETMVDRIYNKLSKREREHRERQNGKKQ